jgi:hypothetical protein
VPDELGGRYVLMLGFSPDKGDEDEPQKSAQRLCYYTTAEYFEGDRYTRIKKAGPTAPSPAGKSSETKP